MVSRIFHYLLASFLELIVGCAKIGLKIYPILMEWTHLIPGFNFVLELRCPVDNPVGNIGCMDIIVRIYSQFPVPQNIFDWVENGIDWGLRIVLH